MQPTALVTGATRGIGKAIALELARHGFDVAVTGRTRREGTGFEERDDGTPTPLPGSLDATSEEIEARGRRVLPIAMDLLDPGAVDAAIETFEAEWGTPDVLVNNAMVEAGRYTLASVDATPLAEFAAKLQANFMAPLAITKAFLPGMVARGHGRVINLSTRHNYTRQAGPPGSGGASVSYNCSKAALGKLADGLAAEHADDGVLAFDVDPGPVWTERSERQHERLGYPKEIFCPLSVPAVVVRWLALEEEAARYNGAHFMAQEFALQREIHEPWGGTLPMNRRWSPTAILDWRERGRARNDSPER